MLYNKYVIIIMNSTTGARVPCDTSRGCVGRCFMEAGADKGIVSGASRSRYKWTVSWGAA